MSAALPIDLNEREKSLVVAMFLAHKDGLNYNSKDFAAIAGYKNANAASASIGTLKKKLGDYFAAKASGNPTVPSTPATGAIKRKATTSTGSKANKAVKIETPSKTMNDDVKVEADEDADTGALGDA
ncbi:hypothetical protein MBLNU457_4577t1 [Dothideomycetes sp. NU457]